MRKLILVGNGFDLAHGLKTRYSDFVEKYATSAVILKYRELVENELKCGFGSECESNTWYNFESQYEKLVQSVFRKNFDDGTTSERVENLESKVEQYNEIFDKVPQLLKEYLKEEMNRSVKKLGAIEDEITKDSYVISFNYTDTIKLYTENCNYIHGSISEDDYIILGFAEGNVPDSMGGSEYIRFWKDPLKEKLNYKRYLASKGCIHVDDLLKSIDKYLPDLFGGVGGYINPSELDEELYVYAQLNNFLKADLKIDVTDVEEVVVIGHGLNSDTTFVKNLLCPHRMRKLKKVILFTYPEADLKDQEIQIKKLKEWSGKQDISLRSYYE